MLCWNDVDNGKAWSGTSPTLEAAKIFAQHIEDEMAKIWTLSAVTGEVKRIVTEVAANHGPMFASTDYDKALGRQAWKDAFLKVTKQSGNVVDIVKTKNTVSQLSGHRNFGIWLRRVLRRAL